MRAARLAPEAAKALLAAPVKAVGLLVGVPLPAAGGVYTAVGTVPLGYGLGAPEGPTDGTTEATYGAELGWTPAGTELGLTTGALVGATGTGVLAGLVMVHGQLVMVKVLAEVTV